MVRNVNNKLIKLCVKSYKKLILKIKVKMFELFLEVIIWSMSCYDCYYIRISGYGFGRGRRFILIVGRDYYSYRELFISGCNGIS